MAKDSNKADKANKKAAKDKDAAKEAKEEKSQDTQKLSKKVQKIVDSVKELSLMEVSELVKALEEEFDVSAAAPVMMGAMPAGAGNGEQAAVEEKDEFDVVLKDAGSNKIAAIKAVRALKSDLGLSDAKAFVESAPKTVLEEAKKEEAQEAKKKLEEAGCVVELK
ncbi:MAG: 50S ribosomal protein L7/L12 [Candidatus Pacebacteria bacterium]|nr:50S ribosomal protein L7/L12 [Candidatus Paceibacterota bacterium]